MSRSLLLISRRRTPSLLLLLMKKMLPRPAVASQLLDDLCLAATYGEEERAVVKQVWPELMNIFLETWEEVDADNRLRPERTDRIIASMIPQPKTRMSESEIEAKLDKAGRDWVDPVAISPMIDRWIQIAAGIPECVDAIAWFLIRRPIAERVQFGLPWLEKTIDSRFDQVAGRTWALVEWIEEILNSGQASDDALRRFRCIIDGLAARADSRALRLQRSLDGGA